MEKVRFKVKFVGEMNYADGDKYVGDWVNEKKKGRGKILNKYLRKHGLCKRR